jgi:hypothetical protein
MKNFEFNIIRLLQGELLMKSMYTLIIFLIISSFAIAEDSGEKKDTLWAPNGNIGINFSQISFSNWTQGGENSLSFTFFSILGLDYIGHPWNWNNSLKLTYGRNKSGGNDYRTNDNEIYFESVLVRNVGWKANPYADFTFRTAITKGFNYETDPATQIVNIFDPAYLTEGIGMQYETGGVFTQRAGIAFKQTLADKFKALYSDDAATPDEIESFKFESGLESVTEVKYEFLENMNFQSYLRLFTRFDAFDVWDVRWDNIITAKINDYFNVNFNVLLIYDESQSIQRQLKQALQIGVSYNIF